MIPVTKPFLPPKNEFDKYLEGIWNRNWLTNNGPLVNELELKLKEHLGLDHLLFVTNGTIALQIAIKALDLNGEIITTPFSYVATTSSIVWEGCKPVFVDIDPETLNIDARKIEQAITPQTTAIIATHVYGNPCDIESIQSVADQHNLKVIYDGAHGFGTKYKGKSIFEFGDISTVSFHATKIFHTVEGGAVITPSPDILKKMAFLRNFGHDGPYNFAMAGINGKNSELHAAMGLCNLKYLDEIITQRKLLSEYYDEKLQNLKVTRPMINSKTEYNFSYYPIIFENEETLLKASEELEKNYIFTRRYFFPSLNKLNYVPETSTIVHSEDISKRILCLPLYHQLSFEEIDLIARLLLRSQKY
jgi:dTDP-4-amino-4,6-dideoxygalactose transaminase